VFVKTPTDGSAAAPPPLPQRATGATALDNLVRIPQPTIERLSAYLQCVRAMRVEQVATASSLEIAARTGINAAQFRKDLSYFGEFGKPGLGYNVAELEAHLSRLMGLDEERDVLLVGVGNLGRALLLYMGFAQRGFHIAAAFDVAYRRITDLPCPVYHPDTLAKVNRKLEARIGIMTVPGAVAQRVADQLVSAGVQAILNFAPVALTVPAGITLRNVDLTSQLEVLSYYLRPQ
jgi:redox-sensing transcriptional repressor